MESKAVGMIGLGIMGSAMSASLIRAGFRVVGYDVLARRRQDLRKAGGTPARSCREAAKRCDILVTSLPSSEALLDTAAELAKSARARQIVIETSTLPIPVKEEARKRLAARGVILLDCTLSGTGIWWCTQAATARAIAASLLFWTALRAPIITSARLARAPR